MKTVLLSVLSIAILAGAPLAAADEAPAAASSLCSLAPNPLQVDFGAQTTCNVTAECAPFIDVSCSASGTNATCTGADRDCSSGSSGQRGYVTCNGSTTYCGGQCCGSDGKCEAFYGCGSSDPDCPCLRDRSCNYSVCGCSDPDCSGRPECVCQLCSSVTNCKTNDDCLCPGSLCLSNGTCLCAG